MKDVLRSCALVLLLAVVLSVLAPGLFFALRLADSWTQANTDQLLGGLLALCGSTGAIIAVLIGAGLFALPGRLAAATPSIAMPTTR